MNQQQHQHLLELIVNSSAKEQGNFALTAELVCQQLREYCQVSQVFVWLFDEQEKVNHLLEQQDKADRNVYQLIAHSHGKTQLFSQFASHRKGVTTHADYINELRLHRYIQASDAQSHPLLTQLHDYYCASNITSVLDVAIRINGHIEGILSIEHDSLRQWTVNERQFIIQCADQLALTLATRYSYDKSERINLLRTAIEQSEHVVIVVNLANGIIEYVNKAHHKMTGLKRENILNNSVMNLDIFRNNLSLLDFMLARLKRGKVISGEKRLTRQDGSNYYLHYHVSPFETDQGNVYGLVSCYDNSTENEYRAELEKQAWQCSLTGLHNRAYFKSKLKTEQTGYLVIIDLLGFKRFNDTHGHDVGDGLLIETARRLRHFGEANNAIDIARIGSDEFAVIFPEQQSEQYFEFLIQKLYDKICTATVISRQKIEPNATLAAVNLATVFGHYSPLSCADIALQYAKGNNTVHIQFFNQKLLSQYENNVQIDRDLHTALNGRQFELYYQPLKDLQTSQYIGAEALIRWNHPRKGVVYPGDFIGIAEQSDLIIAIGDWVLESACKQLNLWQHKDVDIKMHVNVAARQFFSGNLFEHVWTMLTRYRIKPHSLILEITETELMGDVRSATLLCQELSELGVGLAIDDFGTGYSSMKYLKQFPISKLKIDRSFIMDISTSRESREIVSAIIAMANALNLSLTAEGVETVEQQQFLAENGCHHAQGYLYSKALRTNDFAEFYNSAQALTLKQNS
ncbi:EAL domain-containing protein [Shewanella intestini]|uniref:EAL domain-containing protein n=1 Tax=Shewanella intestini TaxID=2017544 RepID=A0ABS5I0P1_9GAMM|nr:MULTISPECIES: EAL domain-containing protein [Shewanella]MBR9727259.1 EAL domain-containing protein [Shewanella intestini]MRG36061.1 EAL domain-containing protein [Shewanella sp. XMDDZSB0408]